MCLWHKGLRPVPASCLASGGSPRALCRDPSPDNQHTHALWRVPVSDADLRFHCQLILTSQVRKWPREGTDLPQLLLVRRGLGRDLNPAAWL